MNWNILISAIAGIIAGSIGGLVAPWSRWGVEKRRIRQKRKYKVIDDCYKMIASYQRDNDVDLFAHPAYIAIREHLRPDTVKELEKNNQIYVNVGVRGVGADHESTVLLNELARIKKEWKL